MALNARVIGAHGIEAGRIHDVRARRLRGVAAAGSVAPLAADIPLGHGLRRDVEVHRVTAIARLTRCAVRRVRAPDARRDVPRRRQRNVVIAVLREVALLPFAAVDERDLILRKRQQRVGLGEIRNERVGMTLRIAYNVRHPRHLPPLVDR